MSTWKTNRRKQHYRVNPATRMLFGDTIKDLPEGAGFTVTDKPMQENFIQPDNNALMGYAGMDVINAANRLVEEGWTFQRAQRGPEGHVEYWTREGRVLNLLYDKNDIVTFVAATRKKCRSKWCILESGHSYPGSSKKSPHLSKEGQRYI